MMGKLRRDIDISTPENVPISYELAGLGSRSLAAITDIVVQMAILFALAGIAFLVNQYHGRGLVDLPRRWLTAIIGIAVFVVIWGYYFYFEAFNNGQTPGKRSQGLRVIRDGGFPIDPTAAAVRNLVRIVDFLPWMYLIGVWTIFISPQCKRLGDYAAGTIVVKERTTTAAIPEVARTQQESGFSFTSLIPSVAGITPEEYRTVKRFLERQIELRPAIRRELAQRIALPLMEKLGIDPTSLSDFEYSDFLAELQRRCREEKGYL